MGKIPYLLEKDVNKYIELQEVSSLETVSDVATLLEVFEETVKTIDYRRIKYVVEDTEKYYYIVVSDKNEDFDLFGFVNDTFKSEINITCINARLVFPRRLSRGIYAETTNSLNDSYCDEDEEDVATSFLDEEELGFSSIKEYELYHAKTGVTVKIGKKGLIIGRSPKKVDYLVRNNNIGRVHCNLYVDDMGNLKVHDFESLNGTFVNGRKVHVAEDVQLSEADVLTLADEEFRVI